MFRKAMLVLCLALPALLAACLLSPGKFTSDLAVNNDGTFEFSYVGELVVLRFPEPEFTPFSCYDDDTFEERDCTEEELAQQRKEWEEQQAQNSGPQGMPGGADPTSDEAIADLVKELGKQKGWEKISYRGEGIIDVEYRIKGQVDHGFAFPLIDSGPGFSPFIVITRRKDDAVQVSGTGLVAAGAGGMGNLGAMAGAGGSGEMPDRPQPDGTFTIRTNGEILTNNTEDGPSAGANGGRVLSWRITPSSDQPPKALIRIGQ